MNHDFTEKLRKTPEELEILGDGTHAKSYRYINDCMKIILSSVEKTEKRLKFLTLDPKTRQT